MKEQGYGSIVNTASVGGTRGVGHQSGYSADKDGAVGLTLTLQLSMENLVSLLMRLLQVRL